MTYIVKPRMHHPALKTNALGLTRRDYEGRVSTLCAGCGHDSISAAIVQAARFVCCSEGTTAGCGLAACLLRRLFVA